MKAQPNTASVILKQKEKFGVMLAIAAKLFQVDSFSVDWHIFYCE